VRPIYTRIGEIHQTFCREYAHLFYNVRRVLRSACSERPTEWLGTRLEGYLHHWDPMPNCPTLGTAGDSGCQYCTGIRLLVLTRNSLRCLIGLVRLSLLVSWAVRENLSIPMITNIKGLLALRSSTLVKIRRQFISWMLPCICRISLGAH
jgi:hypothetical protein